MSDPKTTETPELTPDQQLFALLKEVSKSLTDGLESPGLLEPDWSRHDRALVWRIDQVIAQSALSTYCSTRRRIVALCELARVCRTCRSALE